MRKLSRIFRDIAMGIVLLSDQLWYQIKFWYGWLKK